MNNASAPGFTPLICYEVVFSGLVPQGEHRPDWILNVSNDAWFGPTAGPRQHLNITRYQAIETGLPVIRVASRGYSGTIDPYGRMPVLVDRRYEGATDVNLPMPADATLYARSAGTIFWAMYILSILFISVIVIQRQLRS